MLVVDHYSSDIDRHKTILCGFMLRRLVAKTVVLVHFRPMILYHRKIQTVQLD